MMLRCQASCRAAAEPNRRERGRKEEGKWQTWAWGILGATKNSTEKRRGEWWRVYRHNDEGNIGWVIFSCFKNEMFCSQNKNKINKRLYSCWIFFHSNQTTAILETAVFYKSRLDQVLMRTLASGVGLDGQHHFVCDRNKSLNLPHL